MDSAINGRMLRISEVKELVGLSRSTIYRGMQEGSFPQARKISARAVGWWKPDVDAYLAARPKATGSEPP